MKNAASYALALLCAALFGLSTVIEKRCVDAFGPGYVFFVTGSVFAVVAQLYWFRHRGEFNRLVAAPEHLRRNGLLVGTVLLTVVLPYYLFFRALKGSKQTHIVSALTATTPLFAMLISAVVLRQRVTVMSAAGIVLIVAGCGLAVWGAAE